MGRWLLRHQRSLLFLFTILAIAGIFAAFKIPVSIFPNIQFPRIVVSVDSGDIATPQMITEVTKPLEQVLENVPNVVSVKSVTSRGATDLSMSFAWGVDMVTAKLQVQSAVNQALPGLPSDTTFTVTRMDPASRQMMGFSLTSTNPDLVRLRNFALMQLRPLLATIPGVARVEILGGNQAEYDVTVNPVKLQSYGLSLSDISQVLASSNVVTTVGKLEDQYQLYLVMADNQLQNLQDIQNLTIPVGKHSDVHLGDIATVTLGTAPNWTTVTAHNQNAVLINLYQQENANTVAITHSVDKRLAAFKHNLPSDMHLSLYYDQSQLILGSADSVRDAIIIGAILAGIILFVFLRNARMMLIVALVLPVVLAITTLLLNMLGMSFNIMTLGGMAAAVGLVIDDGVVMLEHMTRRLSEAKGQGRESIIQAAMEMLRPLAGSSLATIIIFLPLAFLSGFTGGFFKALALTMASALIISFFVAFFAVPLLSKMLLKSEDAIKMEHAGKFVSWMHAGYVKHMQGLFRKNVMLWIGLVIFIAIGAFSYTQVATGFIPPVDEGGFVLDYQTAPGTSLAESDRLLNQAEKIISADPDVNGYSRRTGLQMGGGLTEPNTGDIYIHLKNYPRDSVDVVENNITNKINAEIPGLTVLDTVQMMEDMIGDLTDTPQPIEVKIYGPDQTELQNLATTISNAMNNISGIADVNNGIVIAGDSINIHIHPAQAAFFGLTVANIAVQIDASLKGNVATSISSEGYSIGVRVITPSTFKSHISTLSNLPILTTAGKIIPLQSLATISILHGQAEIDRENLQQMIGITAGIQGRDIGSVMKDVMKVVASTPMPPGFTVSYGGLYEQQQQSMRDLSIIFVSAFLLIALLLLFLYERFSIVFSILCTTLLTLPGVFLSLWVTNTELDVSSIMGMIMILGIVTEIAIFYFAELTGTPELLTTRDLIHAGVMRMRPILMTSLIAVLALLPLALGSSMQTPLATAIIAGLIFAVPLVLFVMPVLYAVFSGKLHSNKNLQEKI